MNLVFYRTQSIIVIIIKKSTFYCGLGGPTNPTSRVQILYVCVYSSIKESLVPQSTQRDIGILEYVTFEE